MQKSSTYVPVLLEGRAPVSAKLGCMCGTAGTEARASKISFFTASDARAPFSSNIEQGARISKQGSWLCLGASYDARYLPCSAILAQYLEFEPSLRKQVDGDRCGCGYGRFTGGNDGESIGGGERGKAG